SRPSEEGCSLSGRDGDAPMDDSAASHETRDRQDAPDSVEAVGHPLQPGAVARGVRIEAAPVVLDLEHELAVRLPQPPAGRGPLGVLPDVLHRLQHAEVHGGLYLLWIAADPVGLYRGRH